MTNPAEGLMVPSEQLWLPGKGLVPTHIRQAAEAISQYDQDLGLGQDKRTGDWVVLMKGGPEGRPYPVFGLGPELPPGDEIVRRLYHADMKRRGHKIIADINRRADAAREESRQRGRDK